MKKFIYVIMAVIVISFDCVVELHAQDSVEKNTQWDGSALQYGKICLQEFY